MRIVEFQWQGKTYRGAVASKGATTWISVAGEVWTQTVEKRKHRNRLASGALDLKTILAPMPGKIIKTVALIGADVKVGDVLIVMEAMKMEYTLKAQINGRVEKLTCAVGTQVALGEVLMSLE